MPEIRVRKLSSNSVSIVENVACAIQFWAPVDSAAGLERLDQCMIRLHTINGEAIGLSNASSIGVRSCQLRQSSLFAQFLSRSTTFAEGSSISRNCSAHETLICSRYAILSALKVGWPNRYSTNPIQPNQSGIGRAESFFRLALAHHRARALSLA